MKTVDLSDARLETCVAAAQHERVVLTRAGEPVALLIGLDEDQRKLGASDRFWAWLTERRRQPTISRAELEKRLDASGTG